MINLLLLITCLLSATCFCHAAGKVPVVAGEDLETESGVRCVIRQILPQMATLFYHYDGQQAFGMFCDPSDPTKVLLLVVPDGSVLAWGYRENSELKHVLLTPNRIQVIVSRPGSQPSVNPYESSLGTILQVPKHGKLELAFQIRQPFGDWSMTATRSPEGKWSGTMQQTRANEGASNRREDTDNDGKE